jgi:hypothetical protein
MADDVQTCETELVGGELRDGPDAEAREAIEQRRARALDGDAAVQSAEVQAVAVALQDLEQAVADRPVEVRPGAKAVGDQRREGVIARA